MQESLPRKIWNVIYPPLLLVGIYLVIYVAAIALYYSVLRSSYEDVDDFMASAGGVVSLLALGTSAVFMFFIFRRSGGIRPEPVHLKGHTGAVILAAAAGILASHGLSILVSFMNIDNILGSYAEIQQAIPGWDILLTVLRTVILAPVAEELTFRGLCFFRMKMYAGFWPAAIVSSLTFGIYHLNLAQGIYAFIFGILLCFMYEHFKNLWVPIIVHAAANAFSIILIYLHITYPYIWIYVAVMAAALAAAFIIVFKMCRNSSN